MASYRTRVRSWSSPTVKFPQGRKLKCGFARRCLLRTRLMPPRPVPLNARPGCELAARSRSNCEGRWKGAHPCVAKRSSASGHPPIQSQFDIGSITGIDRGRHRSAPFQHFSRVRKFGTQGVRVSSLCSQRRALRAVPSSAQQARGHVLVVERWKCPPPAPSSAFADGIRACQTWRVSGKRRRCCGGAWQWAAQTWPSRLHALLIDSRARSSVRMPGV